MTRRRFLFDARALGSVAAERHDEYVSARPFPHVVLDGLLNEDMLHEVLAEFPTPNDAMWRSFDSPLERKLATNESWQAGEATARVLAELNSGPFIDFLENLTGIKGLTPDPHFIGGGLHQIEPEGHLAVHADFNRHERTGLERRLNVLVYLNQDWNAEYAGALELWDRHMRQCEVTVTPYFNRCVVFSTTRTSYHGHPEPLRCPAGQTRKSIATYYYSRPRIVETLRGAQSTLFPKRRDQSRL